MIRKAVFLTVLCLCLLLAGCGAVASANTNGSSSQVVGNANIVVVTSSSTTVQASSGGPTDTPTSTTSQPPAQPTTDTTGNGNHQCNSGGCANPWGYIIGLNNTQQGKYIYTPPSGFCDWFACIANFDNGRGYIVECFDGKMSKSGGIQGSCSRHQGEWEPLYILISGVGVPTPTPVITPKPSPSPSPRPSPSPVPTAATTG